MWRKQIINQLWNLSGILVPHLNITLLPIQDFHVLHIHQGSIPDFCLHSFRELPLPTRLVFFVKTGEKTRQPSTKFMVESYCGSWLLKVVHLLADQGVWRLGICCHHECQASRLHFGFLCHLASPVLRETPENNKTHVIRNGRNHAGRLGRVG